MPNGTDDSMSSRKAESDVNGENTFKIGNFSVDEARPIKVVVIGAGYSGKHYSVHCQCHLSRAIQLYVKDKLEDRTDFQVLELSNPEVKELHTSCRSDEYVCGFQVPMHDQVRVCIGHRFAHLQEQI